MESPVLDLSFPVFGKTIPVDHGYALYGALSRICPFLHDSGDVGLHLIRGRYIGDGLLQMNSLSRLNLRLPAEKLPLYLSLAGKALEIDGHTLRLGVPNPFLLRPAAILYAHLVTTRNGHDEERFKKAIVEQLDVLNIKGQIAVGKRRTFKVHEKQIVGYSLLVSGLTAKEAIKVQEKGVGGRRRFGCGIFLPVRKNP